MLKGAARGRNQVGPWAFRLAVILVSVLAFFPVADWIPGEPGSNLPPPLWPLYLLWVLGLLVLSGAAWGVVKLFPGGRRPSGGKTEAGESRRRGRRGIGRKPKKTPGAPEESSDTAPGAFQGFLKEGWAPVAVLLVLPALLYAVTAREVFDGRPLHIDSMTQALQAHIFADGRLSVPVADHPRFFSSALVVESEGRAFSQFPPGWSGLLALGFLLGIPWLMAPLCGALAVVGLYSLLRESGEAGGQAFFMACLFALSPWFVFNSATWMSHVPAVCFILLGSLGVVRGVRRPSAWVSSALGGAGLGVALLIRPLEGVAFGLPATIWMATRAARDRLAWKNLGAFAAGGALTVGLLLAYNWVQHGNPTLFGFELQWGPEHRLGFHEAPWGPPHTVLRGVQLLNGYLLGLQLLFFDAPAPSLLLALTALLLASRLDALDRYLLAGSGLLLLGYMAFWGEGQSLLGPRYLLPLAPVVSIWTVRFGRVLAERTGRRGLRRWGYALVVLFLMGGWVFGTPTRWTVYSASDPLRRVDVGALTSPSARNALVFVSSPWSIQVQARLRATGLSRQQARWFYFRVGLCRLDLALAELEDRNVTEPDQVAAALLPLAADSASMVLDPFSGSPGDPYTGLSREDEAALDLCRLRQTLEEAQGGYMLLPFQAMLGPTWTEDGPILAHDLHEENRRLLTAYPERTPYALRPTRVWGRIRHFRLVPLDADSVETVWGTFERLHEQATVF
ncbi:MAG: hypothetical protein R6T96_07725 [Longimicrobiales bacterium]